MNTKGMFYTNVDDYKTKEDMMNDFIALRMYDMSKDKEIERLKRKLKYLNGELNRYKSIIYLCKKGLDCDKDEYR